MKFTDAELAYIYDALKRLTLQEADGISSAGGIKMRDKLIAALDEYFNNQ